MDAWIFYNADGISNVNYTVIKTVSYPLFKHLYLHIPGPPTDKTSIRLQYDKDIENLEKTNKRMYRKSMAKKDAITWRKWLDIEDVKRRHFAKKMEDT